MLGVLGDAEERVQVAELVHFFAVLAAVAAAAFLLGLKLGAKQARRLLAASVALTLASFVVYVLGTNHSRTSDEVGWLRDVADYVVFGSWAGLAFAGGILGPAFLRPAPAATTLSALATILVLTLGTHLMFALGCVLAGECL